MSAVTLDVPATPRAMNLTRARVDGIDVLRGLAIVFVLLNHVNMRLFLAKVPYTAALPPQLVSTLFWKGQYAVQMFFALSGFLITTTLLGRFGSLGQVRVRDFYALRVARIVPLLLLLLLLAVLALLHAAQLHDFVVQDGTGGLARALLAALTFHINLLEARRGYLPANWNILWSLSVEEMFYLGYPLLCRLSGGGRMLSAVLWIFVALGPLARTAFAHGNEVWAEYSYLGGMDAIAIRCLAAIRCHGRNWSQRELHWLTVLGGSLLVLLFGFSKTGDALGLARCGLNMTLLAIGISMLAIAATVSAWRAPGAVGLLLTLGQRSYEIYLTHMFAVFGLFDLYLYGGKPPGSVPLLFIAAILCAAVLGDAVARSFSEPTNRSLRRWWLLAV